jgi:two-component system NarL family response regulator
MKPPIRVCIMHDHRLFFDAVWKMLRQQDTVAVVNPASDTRGFKLPHLDTSSPPFDIALIDATMDNPDAISTTRDCKQLFPLAKSIIIGLEPCETAILQAIEAGANGYTVKDASCSELLYTIQAVHDGQTPWSPRIAA